MTGVVRSPSACGLSAQEAAARLAAEGPNLLPRPESRSLVRIVAEILREPMFSLLLGAGAIYLVLGDLKEAIILFLFACTSVWALPWCRKPAPSACSKACAI